MALTSISFTIENNPYTGSVDWNTENQAVSLGDIGFLSLYRRVHGINNTYFKIYEKEITSLNDLTIAESDFTAKSGTVYDYYIELTDTNTATATVLEFLTVNGIESWFDGLFIGNYEKQYMAYLDCSTTTKRSVQSEYVTTLNGRTPYVVSNSNINYTTGSSSGLFSRLDNRNQPIAEMTDSYRDEVVDFLTDGTNKIIKTNTGGMWYVSIDPEVNIENDDRYIGHNIISFNWTEIDDVPLLREVATT